jgi:hypothetical protein
VAGAGVDVSDTTRIDTRCQLRHAPCCRGSNFKRVPEQFRLSSSSLRLPTRRFCRALYFFWAMHKPALQKINQV